METLEEGERVIYNRLPEGIDKEQARIMYEKWLVLWPEAEAVHEVVSKAVHEAVKKKEEVSP